MNFLYSLLQASIPMMLLTFLVIFIVYYLIVDTLRDRRERMVFMRQLQIEARRLAHKRCKVQRLIRNAIDWDIK